MKSLLNFCIALFTGVNKTASFIYLAVFMPVFRLIFIRWSFSQADLEKMNALYLKNKLNPNHYVFKKPFSTDEIWEIYRGDVLADHMYVDWQWEEWQFSWFLFYFLVVVFVCVIGSYFWFIEENHHKANFWNVEAYRSFVSEQEREQFYKNLWEEEIKQGAWPNWGFPGEFKLSRYRHIIPERRERFLVTEPGEDYSFELLIYFSKLEKYVIVITVSLCFILFYLVCSNFSLLDKLLEIRLAFSCVRWRFWFFLCFLIFLNLSLAAVFLIYSILFLVVCIGSCV